MRKRWQKAESLNRSSRTDVWQGAGTLTLSGATRLTVEEATTGARLATQLGEHLTESTHLGAEFVSEAGKTYDAMGKPVAYAAKNWGVVRISLNRFSVT